MEEIGWAEAFATTKKQKKITKWRPTPVLMNEETQTLSTPFNAFDNGVTAADVRQRETSNTVAPDRHARFASSRRDTEYMFDAMQKIINP